LAETTQGYGAATLWVRLQRFALGEENYASSRLFIFAKFLEAGIASERIEHRIESEQRRSERHVFPQGALARYRE
jgi:hypothetical protein